MFNLLTDEDYYKPIATNGAFNCNYVEYESKVDKNKTLSIKKYLNMRRSCVSNIINYHQAQRGCKFHSGNAVID